jgi:hypothetical protein
LLSCPSLSLDGVRVSPFLPMDTDTAHRYLTSPNFPPFSDCCGLAYTEAYKTRLRFILLYDNHTYFFCIFSSSWDPLYYLQVLISKTENLANDTLSCAAPTFSFTTFRRRLDSVAEVRVAELRCSQPITQAVCGRLHGPRQTESSRQRNVVIVHGASACKSWE